MADLRYPDLRSTNTGASLSVIQNGERRPAATMFAMSSTPSGAPNGNPAPNDPEHKIRAVLAILIVTFFGAFSLVAIVYGMTTRDWSLFEHIWLPYVIVITSLGNYYFFERRR